MGPYDTKQKQTPRHRDTVQSHQTLGGPIREAGLSHPAIPCTIISQPGSLDILYCSSFLCISFSIGSATPIGPR